MGTGKTLFGILMIAIGTTLLIALKISTLIYGSTLIVIGITFLLFPSEENKIEQRKDLNNKKAKK